MGRDVLFNKNQILKAAFLVFKHNGVDKFTIRNIAAALDSSTSPIYYHFKSLGDLENAMVGEILELFLNPIKKYENYYSYENLSVAFALFSIKHRKLFKAIFLTSSPKLGNPIREKMYDALSAILSKDQTFDWEKDRGDLFFSDGLALRFYNSFEEYQTEEEMEEKIRELLQLRKK
ncbi:TetR/AcrR family transcriptional regulator [Fusobacterium necrophorum]|uniref:TetR family transcriptional regulator n=3 Tax=Fusobacterium necrophorum TaxID=859 RepID=A0AB73BYC2_9FUSO|nr:TetR/AcrR family transcriptional regulator [Fusobacterium necrophorum]AYZ73640.1 TetR/AcrR family transcriptional regulator [Fusobacterium necrophorum]AZW08356.1 TetR/AcrR family transcriptional regulator [Fusobacterium necrophorum subsp. necrophorum]KDE64970.1 TetR family transcriptional regulator [Fusobacterium necrophorum BL]KDE66764.1 TetR family transcriptional regulator [Fusobacterium necrophorum BFTR-1]KDE71835.1 TetR family transcriptional regulator [Fusobacterium necrophorum DJ-2]